MTPTTIDAGTAASVGSQASRHVATRRNDRPRRRAVARGKPSTAGEPRQTIPGAGRCRALIYFTRAQDERPSLRRSAPGVVCVRLADGKTEKTVADLDAAARGGEFETLRARLDALGVETLDDEGQLRTLRLELDQLSRSLDAAREAADAASVESQLRRLRSDKPDQRARRLHGLLGIYAGAIDALEELEDPATAGLILRLALRRARIAEELLTTKAKFPDLRPL
jgi:hypothetical protein